MRFKNILSFLSIAVFFVIAAASSNLNKMHCGAFNMYTYKHDNDNRNFIVKNDGTIIYGDKIVWTFGIFSNRSISIDKEKYKVSEVKGYQMNGVYYGRYGYDYLERIVTGKLNVYYSEETSRETTTWHSGTTTTRNVEHCYFYVQRRDEDQMYSIKNQSDIKNFVGDCPKSYAMIDKSSKEIRKAIRSNSNYLNEIFEVYNNGCK
jgi:hypothetical protein